MESVSVLAITKNGIKTGIKLKQYFPSWKIYAPVKFSDDNENIQWFTDTTTQTIEKLFKTNDALVCIFSLGAVIRLISPHIKDKKTDPAVLVIDDKANFVISTLSGHLGGANELTNEVAKKIGATPIITTAADVNKTIAVDLVGKEFGWKIDENSPVTKVSALMVNEERIGIFQDVGETNWLNQKLPLNVTTYSSIEELKNSESKGCLIISDKIIDDQQLIEKSVIYRPPTLVVGIGLHWDTTKETILENLNLCLKKFKLDKKSILKFVSIKKEKDVKGLIEVSKDTGIQIEYFEREELADITIPNPSKTVQSFEGTPSVSEAAAIKSSEGELIVEKQKFPPNLTIAIARIPN